MQDWRIYAKKADFERLAREYGISPVTARIMINRNVAEDDFAAYLRGDMSCLHDPHLLKDIDEAAFVILNAIDEQQKIRIVGDYDIDGVCSTYILVKSFRDLGADADFRIPDRVRDGYGINESIINEAKRDGVDLIVTCDNGISAYHEMELAESFGISVVITDHHEVPKDDAGNDVIPPAECVVNAKQSDDGYPYKEICGGMTAFKLVQVMHEHMGLEENACEEFIPFAAMATVGDVMPLQDENRIIVREGLRRMSGTSNIGLRTLISLCGLDINALTAFHIGFVIGPCLNAGGRLESASIAMNLLLSTDSLQAEKAAQHLKTLNDERKNLTEVFTRKACEIVENEYSEDTVKVIYLPDCHESVAGIIAGRVREACNHPVLVLTDADCTDETGEPVLKGSARSIDAYNIFEKLTEVRDLFLKFGGHKLAAGMSLRKSNLETLRRLLNERSGLTDDDFVEKKWIDVPLPFGYCSESFVEELKLLEPFGQGNEKPVFAQKAVEIVSARAMGRNHNVVKLQLKSMDGTMSEGVIFTDADEWLKGLALRDRFDILYYPQVNEFQGRKNVQMIIREWRRC